MPNHELLNYRYRGARALVLLHERTLRELLQAWRRAKASHVQLPSSADPNYVSLESVLHHGLRAARGYMTWLCEKLDLQDPGIDLTPEASLVEQEAEPYIEHLLERWRLPLADVEKARFAAIHKTRWGEDMSCEGMLEHAVMHPIRHRFQLEELIEAQDKK
jgi:hypothetical protein